MKPQQIAIIIGLIVAGTAAGIGGYRYNIQKAAKTLELCNQGVEDECYKIKDKSLIANPDYHYRQKVLKNENAARLCATTSVPSVYCNPKYREIDIEFLKTTNPELAEKVKGIVKTEDIKQRSRDKWMTKREEEELAYAPFKEMMKSGNKTLMVWRCNDAIKAQLKDPRSFERINATFVPSVFVEAPGQIVDVRINFRAKNSFGGFAGGFGRCGFNSDAVLVRRPNAVNTW